MFSEARVGGSDQRVWFDSADLSWDENHSKPTLRNIGLDVKQGDKIAISGEVGSGKSTLLAAILGEVPITKGTVFSTPNVQVGFQFDAAKLRKLRPSFKETGGTVRLAMRLTCDGAAALVLVSGEKALQLGLKVIAKISGYADAAHAPELFTTAPALAIPKAISNAGVEASNIDYYEINLAFAVVALANQKILSLAKSLFFVSSF